MIVLAMSCIASTGCGDLESPIDPALRPYVDRFEEEMETTVDFRVRFKKKVWKLGGEEKAASCHAALGTRGPKVMIQQDEWENASELQREKSIFHELGHCKFGLPHTSGRKDNGEPTSLMDGEDHISDAHYEEFREEYMEELRSRIRDPDTGCVWFLRRACKNRP
jgi:hypothetical protein